MPRFLGRSKRGLYWEAIALIVLAIAVILVLEVTGTIDLFSCVPGPAYV